jgi:hypothetical protein
MLSITYIGTLLTKKMGHAAFNEGDMELNQVIFEGSNGGMDYFLGSLTRLTPNHISMRGDSTDRSSSSTMAAGK